VDRTLTTAAEPLGISKQESAREPIHTLVDERPRFEEVVQRTVDRFGPVLDRLN